MKTCFSSIKVITSIKDLNIALEHVTARFGVPIQSLMATVTKEKVVKRSDTTLCHHLLLVAFIGCQLVKFSIHGTAFCAFCYTAAPFKVSVISARTAKGPAYRVIKQVY